MTPTTTTSSSTTTTGERTPLFLKQQTTSSINSGSGSVCDSTTIRNNNGSFFVGTATISETVINLTKTCMGTGCLALPYSAQQSGMVLYVVGTFAIAWWNVYSVQRLCHSWELVQQHYRNVLDHSDIQNENGCENEDAPVENGTEDDAEKFQIVGMKFLSQQQRQRHLLLPPPKGTSTLGQVTWFAFGYQGLRIMDILMILLLFGIIVAYQDAILSFLSDTAVADWRLLNAIWSASLMATLSVVHDVAALTKGSAFGLSVLFAAMTILTFYGILSNINTNTHDTTVNTTNTAFNTSTDILLTVAKSVNAYKNNNHHHINSWFPQHGLTGVSQWFGCVAFGFGTVPLTYNFQSSMEQPHQMVTATVYALVGVVATCYILLGLGLLHLYPELEGDVLHVLPTNFWLAQLTRWAMVVVILVTAPLLVVPCGQLIEGKLYHHSHNHHPLRDNSNNHHTSTNDNHRNSWTIRYLVRFGVCYTCAAISTMVPGFVNVLSLVGCASVALVSFCVPPLLHLAVLQHACSSSKRNNIDCTNRNNSEEITSSFRLQQIVDLIMLACGVLATSITTIYTLCKNDGSSLLCAMFFGLALTTTSDAVDIVGDEGAIS